MSDQDTVDSETFLMESHPEFSHQVCASTVY